MLERIWNLLERGAAKRDNPFHTPALISRGLDNAPNARVVVLRGFSAARRELLCHTDWRSPKIAEIQRDARVSYLFYGAPERLQLKIRAVAALHFDDDIAAEHWRATPLSSRRIYCGASPGEVLPQKTSGLPEFLIKRAPTEADTEELGRPNFAVITAQIVEIDCLELSATGNLRTLFQWDGRGEMTTRFLAP